MEEDHLWVDNWNTTKHEHFLSLILWQQLEMCSYFCKTSIRLSLIKHVRVTPEKALQKWVNYKLTKIIMFSLQWNCTLTRMKYVLCPI